MKNIQLHLYIDKQIINFSVKEALFIEPCDRSKPEKSALGTRLDSIFPRCDNMLYLLRLSPLQRRLSSIKNKSRAFPSPLAKFSSENRPFARWRRFTTMTRILYVFPFIFNLVIPERFQ